MTRITTTRFAKFALASALAWASALTIAAQTMAAQTPQPALKETPPKAFASPDEAVQALIDAVSKNDQNMLTGILGSKARSLLTSGDAAQDQKDREQFYKLASAKNHIERSSIYGGAAILLVGDQDWPFPIPLVMANRQWHFDADLGAVEMRARRIGADELDAIEICLGYVNAQQTFSAQQLSGKGPPAYAQRIMSSPGSRDGLYGRDKSPELVPRGLAMAAASAPGAARKPYHGYYFRVLTQQGPNAPGGAHKYVAGGAMIGGFALIAWPAEYGATGIHTFIICHDGVVFEKDLGPRTEALSAQIDSYNPDSSWTAVDSR
jgi:hypothetical protein